MAASQDEMNKAIQNCQKLIREAKKLLDANRCKPAAAWKKEREAMIKRLEKEIARHKRLKQATGEDEFVQRSFGMSQMKLALEELGSR